MQLFVDLYATYPAIDECNQPAGQPAGLLVHAG